MADKASYNVNAVEHINSYNELNGFKSKPVTIITCLNGIDNLALGM